MVNNKFISAVIEDEVESTGLSSFHSIYNIKKKNRVKKWMWGSLVTLVVVLFLPWTQNIRAKGAVTALRQEDRPQELNTVLAGRVIKWYVKEGDFVKKGDTILFISEIKEEYLDPNLIENTGKPVNAKVKAVQSYSDKVIALENQMGAIQNEKNLKLKQAKNKY